MSYFRDFSRYTYCKDFACAKTFNIGWLDPSRKFRVGELPDDLKSILWKYCGHPVMQMAGLHPCLFCGKCPVEEIWDGVQRKLGDAEIRIFGASGDIYAAPNMIFHYVQAHHYRPPTEFLRALSESAPPPSPEYTQKLKAARLDPDHHAYSRALIINKFYQWEKQSLKRAMAETLVHGADATILGEIVRILENSDDAEVQQYMVQALVKIGTPESEIELKRWRDTN